MKIQQAKNSATAATEIDANINAIHFDETELATRWKISKKSLQSQRWKGGGCRYLKINRSVRYRLADIIDFENRNTVESTSVMRHG
jgi:hypothetical protein